MEKETAHQAGGMSETGGDMEMQGATEQMEKKGTKKESRSNGIGGAIVLFVTTILYTLTVGIENPAGQTIDLAVARPVVFISGIVVTALYFFINRKYTLNIVVRVLLVLVFIPLIPLSGLVLHDLIAG